MKLEALMIKAIREFKKVYSNFEIRNIYTAWGSGCWENWKTASFCVEYIEQDGGAYKNVYKRNRVNQRVVLKSKRRKASTGAALPEVYL